MAPLLIIVQNKPTQFDAPLYAYLSDKGAFDLRIIYTETWQQDRGEFDPEVGLSPKWDHLEHCSYERRDLTAQDVHCSRKVAGEIARMSPDLVVISGYFPLFHAKLAWRLKRKKISIGLRSDNTVYHSSFRGIKGVAKKIILPFVLRRYDTWHPVGTLARKYLEKRAGTTHPVFLFPYTIDNDWFAGKAEIYRQKRLAIRKEMGINANNFVILGILKWHEREDPLTLARAFTQLARRHRAAHLVLVGDGPLRSEIMQVFASCNDRVTLPGYVAYSELPQWYAISDLFVHPAPGEPWGVSVNEAMACGLPVLAAKGVGAGADLIKEGITGGVFPDRDHKALAEMIEQLLVVPDKVKAMGSNSFQRISAWNYQQTAEIFSSALAWSRCRT